MDHRQKSTLFKLDHEIGSKYDYQYIGSLNQDQLQAIRSELSADESETVIQDNIRLELVDESDSSKLLGVQVDLSYDDEICAAFLDSENLFSISLALEEINFIL